MEEDSPLSVDYNEGESASNSSIVIDDQPNMPEKANGTGEDAPIETSDDLAYEQQLAEENGTSMPVDTITMYAKTTCNVRTDASTDSAVIGSISVGDSIIVSQVGDWNKVILDDGTEGFVRSDLLTDEEVKVPEPALKPENTQPETPVESTPEPEPQQPANNAGFTQEQTNALIQQMLADGYTTGGDPTGNTEVIHVDPNAAANMGVDISGVTLH